MRTESKITPEEIFNIIHSLLMITKLSHYDSATYAQHKAFDDTYTSLNTIADSISERLIGYTNIRPKYFDFGRLTPLSARSLGLLIVQEANKIEEFGYDNQFPDIENIAQELSGIGSKLVYLSSLA